MGYLLRKTYTKALPENAALAKQKNGTVAKWVDGRGKTRTARLTVLKDGTSRLCFESPVWFARYRDADGRVVEVSTGCRDKAAAQCLLNEYTTREEKIRAGIVSSTEAAAMDYAHVPLSRHLDDCLASLRARGVHPNTVKGRRHYVETVWACVGSSGCRTCRGPRRNAGWTGKRIWAPGHITPT